MQINLVSGTSSKILNSDNRLSTSRFSPKEKKIVSSAHENFCENVSTLFSHSKPTHKLSSDNMHQITPYSLLLNVSPFSFEDIMT